MTQIRVQKLWFRNNYKLSKHLNEPLPTLLELDFDEIDLQCGRVS